MAVRGPETKTPNAHAAMQITTRLAFADAGGIKDSAGADAMAGLWLLSKSWTQLLGMVFFKLVQSQREEQQQRRQNPMIVRAPMTANGRLKVATIYARHGWHWRRGLIHEPALIEGNQMTDWQDISTAPRDGTPIQFGWCNASAKRV